MQTMQKNARVFILHWNFDMKLAHYVSSLILKWKKAG